MQAVGVLVGVDREQRRLGVEVVGERDLEDVGVDLGITVVTVDDRVQRLLRDRRRQLTVDRPHTDLGRVLALQSHVRVARRVVADEDRPEAGRDALLAETLDARAQVVLDRVEQCGAVEESRSHQWRKCRSPVNTIASPSSSARSMIFSSRIPPPGWMTAATPASAAASMPSSNG